jgi:preprotein translocase subunit SecA
MAGRGVDIYLGGKPSTPEENEEVKKLGGLHVIGTERHEARRIDNQLRGRAGRQGDPGTTQFFVSLDDDVIRIFGGDRIKGLMERFNIPEDTPIENGMISKSIESAQGKIEGFNFDARKHILEYDDVLNKQRETIYSKRIEILEKAEKGELKETVLPLLEKYGYSLEDYEKKEKETGVENMRQIEKIAALRVVDNLWIEHLENMESLKDSVRLRAYGQRDPLVEYKKEAHIMFRELLDNYEKMIVESIMRATIKVENTPNQMQAISEDRGSSASKTEIGRNDPCPCGSGKKYKHCHGK